MTSLITTSPAAVELDPGPVPGSTGARPADEAPARFTAYDRTAIERARAVADLGDVLAWSRATGHGTDAATAYAAAFAAAQTAIYDLLITIARMDGTR